jgi:two-component system, LytTR family, response regulator
MRKIRTIIVDDEKPGRENLRAILLNHCAEIEILGEAASVSSARELINEHNPDLVFLDILMPGFNGFDLIDIFPDRHFAVIFVSASLDFGIQALKVGVLDYVLKPINIKDLQLAVGKAAMHIERRDVSTNPDKTEIINIALSHSNGFSVEAISDITRLEADDNYTRVFTISGKQYLISKPLKDFERALPSSSFIRTHKSYMINIRYLKDFLNEDGGIAILSDGFKVPVSKRKSPLFFVALKRFSLMLKS